jgi:hypothetical protein
MNTHQSVYGAWLDRVHSWTRAERGNTQRLADCLQVDRRRLSQWLTRGTPSVPAWSVAPLAKLTGLPLHMDHLPTLPMIQPTLSLAKPTTATVHRSGGTA